MLETEALQIFAKVVETSSISRAASQLRIPRATVSRKLAALEEQLGVRLLQRTTRSMQLTADGRALHHHAALVLDAARAAEASVKRSGEESSGVVRVSMPPMVGTGLPDVLADFAHAHPAVQLELHVANRMVDLRREGFDAAIRATGVLAAGLVARRLSRVALVGVASPAYLGRYGTPASLAELRDHRCLMGFDRDERAQPHWLVHGKPLALSGAAFSNDPHLVLRLAQRGLGIALLPATLVATAVARGELVFVLPHALRVEGSISLVYVERRLVAPQVRSFIDWMVARAPAALRYPSAANGMP